MKRQIITTIKMLTLAGAIVGLNACAKVYRSNMTPTPLFTQKGQSQVEAAVSRNGVNVSAAAAVSPSIAVMANGQFVIKNKTSSFDNYPARGSYGELALGYFRPLKNNWVVEGYLGAGFGSLRDTIQPIDASYPERLDYNKLFLQPNIGYRKEYSAVIFTPRVGYVFGKYRGIDYSIVGEDRDIPKNISFLSVEPTVTFEFGNKRLWGYTQFGMNFNKYTTISSLYNIGVGVKYRFSFKNN